MSDWFRRETKNITTISKRDTKEGSWIKCPNCNSVIYKKVLIENCFVCHDCNHHFRISADEYIKLIIDNNQFEEICENLVSSDPLSFEVPKKYTEQITKAIEKTGKKDAIKLVEGKLGGKKIILAVMDFSFIGGSMGSVVGEKICKGINRAEEKNIPLIMIAASGGARMQEGVYSLMQLAKISTQLAHFSKLGGLYIVLLTDPTTGGVSASFGMQGDIILAEPNALIGFAGPRVIKQTIGENLPAGFQKSEFLLEKGFLDNIVNRKDLKKTLECLIDILGKN